MDSFELELKQGFLEEAAQGISDVEQCFLDLETDPQNPETINKIFRLAHNLKGSSRAVGFDQMGEFTHKFESFILKIKNNEFLVTPKVINILLRANDHLRMMVETYTQNLDAQIDSTSLMMELESFTSEGDQSMDSLGEGLKNEVTPQTEEIINEINILEENGEDKKNSSNEVNHLHLVNDNEIQFSKNIEIKKESEANNKTPEVKSSKSNSAGPIDTSIRVNLLKVENLINFVGEMVILQSVLKEQLTHIDSMLIKKSIAQMGKVSKEIQDLAMGLRMVPVKPTFQKMQRIVRDTAQALNKDVTIHLIGEDTEIDKTILERITDPLVHLVRNAVDHGVETTQARLDKGKNPKGNVTLSAYHKAGRLMIEISDDGGGLDSIKLKNKAIEKKVIRPDQVLTENESFQLIFAPGFSTKEQVTDISGRGVGMDVVKTNISDLGGEVSIQSKLNEGTKFIISLPLTLAIIDAMILSYSKQRFVVPLSHVYETVKPTKEMLTQTTELGDIILLRGEPIPIYRLGDFFSLTTNQSVQGMIAIIVRSSSQPFALLVDDILGQHQVVIKQLTPELENIKGVSGTTILGDGKPAFIIEPGDLIKRKWNKVKPLIMEAA